MRFIKIEHDWIDIDKIVYVARRADFSNRTEIGFENCSALVTNDMSPDEVMSIIKEVM